MTSILKADTIQDTDDNNIINENSNTITIGASGDTTNIIGTLQNNGAAVGGTMKPAFQAYVSSNFTVSHNSNTKIPMNTEVYDTDNAYDNSSNYRFTPQTAGKYVFYAQMTSADTQTANEFEISIRKNGSTVLGGRTTLENFCSINTIGVVDMNGSSDYVEAYAYQNAGGNAILTGNTSRTYFGGYKLIT